VREIPLPTLKAGDILVFDVGDGIIEPAIRDFAMRVYRKE